MEHGTFTPLVFTTTGGFGPAALVIFKHLASLLAIKWDTHYSRVISWIRCKVIFALSRSAVMCIRGNHARHSYINEFSNVDLALVEGKVAL